MIDANTNRYDSIAGNGLSYNAAGNLIVDKDGYEYEYDYENRIVKITDSVNDIAYYSYDALGRRVRKIDSIASQTRLYYYNDNWQVLEEWSGSCDNEFAYVYGGYGGYGG